MKANTNEPDKSMILQYILYIPYFPFKTITYCILYVFC